MDLAIDNIGGKLLPEVIDTLGEHGRVSVVGRLAGPVPSFNTATLFFRRLRLGGVAVGAWSNAESRAAWQQVVSCWRAPASSPGGQGLPVRPIAPGVRAPVTGADGEGAVGGSGGGGARGRWGLRAWKERGTAGRYGVATGVQP